MITEELLAAFEEGKTNAEETALVLEYLATDESLQEEFILSQQLDAMMGADDEETDFLPMAQMAAKSEGNLCDFQCEQFILKRRKIEYNSDELSEEARNNSWLRERGTPLHSVGRLLEQRGLIVMRSYGSSIDSVIRALKAAGIVDLGIAAADHERRVGHARPIARPTGLRVNGVGRAEHEVGPLRIPVVRLAARAAEHTDGLGTVLLRDLQGGVGHQVGRLVPRALLPLVQATVFAGPLHRVDDARRRVRVLAQREVHRVHAARGDGVVVVALDADGVVRTGALGREVVFPELFHKTAPRSRVSPAPGAVKA